MWKKKRVTLTRNPFPTIQLTKIYHPVLNKQRGSRVFAPLSLSFQNKFSSFTAIQNYFIKMKTNFK